MDKRSRSISADSEELLLVGRGEAGGAVGCICSPTFICEVEMMHQR
jgi:hypothetical protein